MIKDICLNFYWAFMLSMLIVTSACKAGDLILHGWSEHIYDQRQDTNENHRMIGYQNNKYEFGYLEDSSFEDVFYAGKVQSYEGSNIKTSFGLSNHSVLPLYVSIRYEFKYVQIGITPVAYFLQLKIPLSK